MLGVQIKYLKRMPTFCDAFDGYPYHKCELSCCLQLAEFDIKTATSFPEIARLAVVHPYYSIAI